tara:strand:+ start:1772 stop:1945 length:174 start_codon:yes stop_codon:yes gene_type:complete
MIVKNYDKWYWGLAKGIGALLDGTVAILSLGFFQGRFWNEIAFYMLTLKSKKHHTKN